jgi:ubiquinone/menaquinone biosynthesis C-methylase UbiE
MRHYNTIASLYTQQYCNEQIRKYVVALERIKLMKMECLLDVGCGTGLFINEIAKMVKETIGIDISRRMLAIAQKACKNLGNVNLICADADYKKKKKKIFDKIVSFTLLQHMPKMDHTHKELLRIAKDDAIIFLTFTKKAFDFEEVKKILNKLPLMIIQLIDCDELKDYLVISTLRDNFT